MNLVVWNDLVERYRKAVLGARLLAVRGVLQKQEGVVNVLARRFEDLSPLLGTLRTESRDFC